MKDILTYIHFYIIYICFYQTNKMSVCLITKFGKNKLDFGHIRLQVLLQTGWTVTQVATVKLIQKYTSRRGKQNQLLPNLVFNRRKLSFTLGSILIIMKFLFQKDNIMSIIY